MDLFSNDLHHDLTVAWMVQLDEEDALVRSELHFAVE